MTLSLPGLRLWAAGFEEDFTKDPATQGWRVFGESNLFRWDSVNQNLEVTWDSSKPNSYFYRNLGVVLSKSDDFQLSFNLRLSAAQAGVNPSRPFTFELAVGLLNFQDATSTNFIRGTAAQSPNLVELDYFPDTGFGATISPVLVSSNNQFVPSFSFPLELTVNDLFHVEMQYTATNQTLSTVMRKNGEPFGPIKDTTLRPSFTDFRVDTIAVSSYSDLLAGGSVLAHGIVDNISAVLPSAPLRTINGGWSTNGWQVQFSSAANWSYALEKTEDLTQWRTASETVPGTGGTLTLNDPASQPTATHAFYRVRAEKR